MPEGPEIRRAADKIAAAIEDKVIEDVTITVPRLKHYESQLRSQRVISVETRGKALLTHFDHGISLYSHNQLYGRWYVVKRDQFPKTSRSLRLGLHTAEQSALLYSATDIEIMPTDEIGMHPFLSKIGPDILNADLHWKEIAERLISDRFRNRSLAALYLDQGFLAGVGNYLRSEILFHAGLNPRSKPKDLTRKQTNRLSRSTLEISRRAYITGGITNDSRLANALKKQGLKRSQYRHAAFNRDQKPCYGCQNEICLEYFSARRLYWCRICQP